MTCCLVRDFDILPEKELHRSLLVDWIPHIGFYCGSLRDRTSTLSRKSHAFDRKPFFTCRVLLRKSQIGKLGQLELLRRAAKITTWIGAPSTGDPRRWVPMGPSRSQISPSSFSWELEGDRVTALKSGALTYARTILAGSGPFCPGEGTRSAAALNRWDECCPF